MHARYAFIYDEPHLHDAHAATTSWIERNGDSNNWSEMCCGYNIDGETAEWASDYRGLDEWTNDFLETYPTFNEAYEYAWEIAIYAAFGENRMPFVDDVGDSVERHEERILSEESDDRQEAFISELWETFRKDVASVDSPVAELGRKTWKLNRSMWVIHQMVDASHFGHIPFVSGGNPYRWRLFDVRESMDSDPESLVYVDIHT